MQARIIRFEQLHQDQKQDQLRARNLGGPVGGDQPRDSWSDSACSGDV